MLSRPMNRFGWTAGAAVVLTFALAIVLFGALGVNASQVSALTPTLPPTSTPTPEPTLAWTFDVSPASPVVGDDIKLTAYASGSGGLPLYTLILEDDPAVVSLESSSSVLQSGPLGVLASWDLGTLGEGEANFHISVNYEREFCLPTHCYFNFTIENSPQMTFGVGAGVAVGGIASLARLESDAPGDRGYAAIQIIPIAASALFVIGALAWLVRRRVFG